MNIADVLKFLSSLSGDDFKEIAGIIHDGIVLVTRVKAFADAHPDLFKTK